MKKLLLLGAVILFLVGCQDLKHMGSHVVSSTTGLNRQITLFAYDGSVIKEWNVKTKIEEQGVGIRFWNENNKSVYIGGTFIIEEK